MCAQYNERFQLILFLISGPLVVPENISEDNCRAIGMVLKRKPLIWDNLYANDYDTKRMFLGPFKGEPIFQKKLIC